MQLKIDLNQKIGKIKAMNATGQAPMGGGIGFDNYKYFHLLSDICVPYVRLHDVGGLYGGYRYVDVPNIFRDFDADENDPKNYDFAFTDAYLAALAKNGLKPYYRLGVTIENHAEVKSYRIDPPADYEKWARICEHIIAHYNEGWANGFHYDIEYWEIWNEPDDGLRISEMWNGTAEDYYRLYDVAAKHLKAKFPNIKIGGYAAIGFYAAVETEEYLATEAALRPKYFLEFFHGFMKYIKAHGSPIDFFSWHSYSAPEKFLREVKWVCEQLQAYGYGHVEKHINEWNPPCRQERDKAVHGAENAATMLGSQNTPMDMLMVYDARFDGSLYSALFLPTLKHGEPKLSPGYYAFAAFSELYKLGEQVALDGLENGVYAVCASNGKKNALMISNISGDDKALSIEGADLSDASWYVLDDDRMLSWSPAIGTVKNNTVVLVTF